MLLTVWMLLPVYPPFARELGRFPRLTGFDGVIRVYYKWKKEG